MQIILGQKNELKTPATPLPKRSIFVSKMLTDTKATSVTFGGKCLFKSTNRMNFSCGEFSSLNFMYNFYILFQSSLLVKTGLVDFRHLIFTWHFKYILNFFKNKLQD